MQVTGKRFSILGMARSGIAAAKKLIELGGIVFLSDNKPAAKIANADSLQKEFSCEFGGHSDKVLNADIIIVSPGIPLSSQIIQKARAADIELISEIELGYRLKAPDSKLICVTGSNGKSTTVTLIHELLTNCGYHSILAGNIGTPFTEYPIEKQGIDFIVLELSSFQLELVQKFKADVAVVLNITPDHLDRYNGFMHYARTKFNIFRNMGNNDLAILNLDDNTVKDLAKEVSAPVKWFSLQEITDGCRKEDTLLTGKGSYKISEIALAGPHNQMNCLAALIATERFITANDLQVKKTLKLFSSLPHRLEYVTTGKGVRFYNDSKATNTDAVKYALLSFNSVIHIILGGSDKGEDFSTLIPYLQNENIHTYLTGATTQRMISAFTGKIKFEVCTDLKAAVKLAYSKANDGEVILLSPACASYDAFRNFIHRGDTFKEIAEETTRED